METGCLSEATGRPRGRYHIFGDACKIITERMVS